MTETIDFKEYLSNSYHDLSQEPNMIANGIQDNQECSQRYVSNSLATESKATNKEDEKDAVEHTSRRLESSNIGKVLSQFSAFEEVECGEPLTTQHLQIDFTPTEQDERDSEKCYELWELINSCADLQKFKVYPINKTFPKSESSQSINEPERVSSPALDWLLKDEKMADAFISKDEKRYCKQSQDDYQDIMYGDHLTKCTEKQQEASSRNSRWRIKGTSNAVLEKETAGIELNKMLKDMDEWDESHPRSMRGPGQVPQLHDTPLKRNI